MTHDLDIFLELRRMEAWEFSIEDVSLEGGPSSLSSSSSCSSSSAVTSSDSLPPSLRRPTNLVVLDDGTMFVAETGNHVIRRIARGGESSVLAGKPGCSGCIDDVGGAARFFCPACLVLDSQGCLFVADSGNDCIRRVILPEGRVVTVAGQSGSPGHYDGSDYRRVRFSCPIGITCDDQDRLYVADAGNSCIRVIRFTQASPVVVHPPPPPVWQS